MKKVLVLLEKYKESFYLFHLLLFIAAYIMGDNTVFAVNYKTIFTFVKYYAVFAVLLKILFLDLKRYTNDTKIRLFLLGVFLLILMLRTNNRYLPQLFILIIGAKEIDFQKLVKQVFTLETVLVLGVVMLAMLGFIDNDSRMRKIDQTIRLALGFKYPPSSSGYVWILTTLYAFLKNGKLHWYEYFGLFFINVVFYFLTDSRNGFICSIAVLILTVLYQFLKTKKIFSWPVHFSVKILMLLLSVLSLSITINLNYKDPNHVKLNNMLSDRIGLQKKAYKQYSIKAFGNQVKWITTDDITRGLAKQKDMNYVDNSYMQYLIEYGWLFCIFLAFMIYQIVKKNQKENRLYENLLWIIILVHAVIDPHLLKISMNIFLFRYVDILIDFRRKRKKLKDGDCLSLEQIHEEQLNMFDDIIDFLDNKDLNYYICGGTLLGAIRHKGFIPWDDDIDIIMPRPDYDKLQEIAKKEKIAPHLEIHSFELGNLNDPMCKIYHLGTEMEKYYIDDEYDNHMWIDIFPMDGLPDDQKKVNKIFKKSLRYRRLLRLRKVRDEVVVKEARSKLLALTKPFLKFIVDLLPTRYYVSRINRLCRKYPYRTSKYVGGIAWGYGPQERMLRSEVDQLTLVEFEGMHVKTFSCWDVYLKNLYGDYMKLPPKEKRVSHVMKVRKI